MKIKRQGIKSKIKSIRTEMKIKYIINLNQRAKLKKIKTSVPNLLSCLNPFRKLKERGPNRNINI